MSERKKASSLMVTVRKDIQVYVYALKENKISLIVLKVTSNLCAQIAKTSTKKRHFFFMECLQFVGAFKPSTAGVNKQDI